MFKKLVSNLAFSPALVGQLGFYANRLKKEEATRRLGLIFTALALVVQSFAVFQPPESANASSTTDMVRGGVSTHLEFLSHYDKNNNNLKDLYTTLGITRTEIANAKKTTINSKGGYYSWGMTKRFSTGSGEHEYNIPATGGGNAKFYYRPLALWDSTSYTKKNGSTYQAFVGNSAKFGWFAIILDCGNLVTKTAPPAPKCPVGYTGTYPNCTKVIPKCTIAGKTNLPANDPNCKPTPAPVTPKCTVPGKTNLPANDHNCKTTPTPTPTTPKCTVPGKTNLHANDPNCKVDTPTPFQPPVVKQTPVAECSYIKVVEAGGMYTLQGAANVANGATVKSYTYSVTKDGKNVFTKVISSSSDVSSTSFPATFGPGNYQATLTVNTSEGSKTGADCAKSFTIPLPEMCPFNPSLKKDDPMCQPCTGDTTIWIKDEKCAASIVQTKTGSNLTQGGTDASKTIAQASDRISYELTIENIGKADTTISIEEQLTDVMEYADVVDNGGGTLNKDTHLLTWKDITLKPGQKEVRHFVVQVQADISGFAQGKSERSSYDCIMTNTFGNSVDTRVACPAVKEVEQVVTQLPHTGPTENMLFAGIVASVVVYFYARSRQLKKEVRLIRRNFSQGTI